MPERDAVIVINGEEREVVIIDREEDFRNGEGRIPNHDKIEIDYCDKEIVPKT